MTWTPVEGPTVRCPHCDEPLWEKDDNSIVLIRKAAGRAEEGIRSAGHRMTHKRCHGRLVFLVRDTKAAA